MSSDIVGIIGPGGEGGTFLDWTLHYLAGQTYMRYIIVDRISNKIINSAAQLISTNPITSSGNAHKHKKTHPTEALVKPCIDLYRKVTDSKIKLLTMYIVASSESYANGESYSELARRICRQNAEMPIIHFYHPDNMSDKLAHRIHLHIPELSQTITEIKNSVLASCNEPDKIIIDPNVYPLNIETMFSDLDTEIHKIFAWLNLPIDEARYTAWLPVYRAWQQA